MSGSLVFCSERASMYSGRECIDANAARFRLAKRHRSKLHLDAELQRVISGVRVQPFE